MFDLKEHNIQFNKRYGQNFITDTNLLTAIVKDAGITEADNVLEIGAGAGTLTRTLAGAAKRVISYEIDQKLRPVLEASLADCPNAELVFEDFLEADVGSVFDGEFKVVANLPYYITTPIIFKLLDCPNVRSITIMVQKEVADRLTALENSEDYGAITVNIGLAADVKTTRIVKRDMFTPRPNVDSAVVHIDINRSKFNIADRAYANRVVRAGFAMRRKMLTNNLTSAFRISKDDAAKLLIDCGFDQKIRGEALSVQDYYILQRTMFERGIK